MIEKQVDKFEVVCLLGEVPRCGAGYFSLSGKVPKTLPKPKVLDFLFANLAAKEMAFKH